ILLAMLQAGPLYAAFPVAALLWKKGCSVRNIFVYLGAFSTLKIPMLAFEIGFLGLEFSLLRALFSLPVFIGIGYLLALVLKDKQFAVKEQG
ncbi:MAG: permease, partial [Candidatus Aminicenantes bacterium]|nr:permease [Candidatus Aminicenantes bacterium]